MGNSDRTRPRHSIQLVSRRTGLSPAAIRAWERRYGLIRPSRTESRRRLYSDEDVDRLRLLRQVTLAGRRIGSVAGLSLEQLQGLVREDERAASEIPREPRNASEGAGSDHVGSCLDALQSFDVPRLEAALRRAGMELSPIALMDEVLIPLLEAIGERWQAGMMDVYQEHLATHLVRLRLEALRTTAAKLDGPQLVVATPAGQKHELGALMVAVTAAAREWGVVYLGPDLPAEEIAGAARRCEVKVVALSIVHPAGDPVVDQELQRLRTLLGEDVQILAGGRAAPSYVGTLRKVGACVQDDLAALRTKLDELRASAV